MRNIFVAIALALWSAEALAAGCPVVRTFPDNALTPGRADPRATAELVCKSGYTKDARHVTAADKRAVMDRYKDACPIGLYEIDHLISLELGGANAVENLWPQTYCPLSQAGKTCFGAREKDVVETWMHHQICQGRMTLQQAQDEIRADWLGAYKRIKGIK